MYSNTLFCCLVGNKEAYHIGRREVCLRARDQTVVRKVAQICSHKRLHTGYFYARRGRKYLARQCESAPIKGDALKDERGKNE